MKYIFYDWFGLNFWLFELANGLGGQFYDRFMLAAHSLGNHLYMKYYIILVVGGLLARLVYLTVRGQRFTRYDIMSEMAMAVVLAMGYAVYGFIIGIIKIVVPLPVPYVSYYYNEGIFHYAGIWPQYDDYYSSFPSSDAATMVFLLVVVWPKLTHPIVRAVATGLVLVVCYAQIAVGMHFPADVVYGAIIGAGVGYVVRAYVYKMLGVSWELPESSPAFAKISSMKKVETGQSMEELRAQIKAEVVAEMRIEAMMDAAREEYDPKAEKPKPAPRKSTAAAKSSTPEDDNPYKPAFEDTKKGSA